MSKTKRVFVAIEDATLNQLKMLALASGRTQQDYLGDLLRRHVEREWPQMAARMAEDKPQPP